MLFGVAKTVQPLKVGAAVISKAATHAAAFLVVSVAGAADDIAVCIFLIVERGKSSTSLAKAALPLIDFLAAQFPGRSFANFSVSTLDRARFSWLWAEGCPAEGSISVQHSPVLADAGVWRQNRVWMTFAEVSPKLFSCLSLTQTCPG